ncbi:F-box/LRR-repeat protein 17 [Tanacetum coccineum]
MGNKTQKFSQELASEIASGQGLSKEVTFLKPECSKKKAQNRSTEAEADRNEIELTVYGKKYREIGTVSFGIGFFFLVIGWPVVGMDAEAYGFITLFSLAMKHLMQWLVAHAISFHAEDTCYRLSAYEPDISFYEALFNTVQDLKKETVEPKSMLPSGELPSPPLEKLLVAMGLLRILETYSIILLVLLPFMCQQQAIKGTFIFAKLVKPLNDVNIANNSFSRWIPKELLSVPAFVYNGNSFDNGPAPPLLLFIPPPPALVLLLFCRKEKQNEHVTRPSTVNPPFSGKKVNAEMSSISDSGIGMICNVFPDKLTRLLVSQCPNITSSGIQFATAQLPLLELMDCGMTICEPDALSPLCEANNDSDSQVSPNNKLHLIHQKKLFIKHARLKKLSLWGCSTLLPEKLVLQCSKLESVHAVSCPDVVVQAVQTQFNVVLFFCSWVSNDPAPSKDSYSRKRMADRSKRVGIPFSFSQPVSYKSDVDLTGAKISREEVGPAHKFLGHTQWLVNYWLLQQGFNIGIGDTIADASTMETINDTISKAKNEVKELIRAAQDKNLKHNVMNI